MKLIKVTDANGCEVLFRAADFLSAEEVLEVDDDGEVEGVVVLVTLRNDNKYLVLRCDMGDQILNDDYTSAAVIISDIASQLNP